MFYARFINIPDRSYRRLHVVCASVFFYLKTETLASLKANEVISREKGSVATYLRCVWTSNSGVIARGKHSTVLEFVDETVDKTDEALECGSLSGPENEQIGPALSKFTLL